jgi:hypothetical protein
MRHGCLLKINYKNYLEIKKRRKKIPKIRGIRGNICGIRTQIISCLPIFSNCNARLYFLKQEWVSEK